jgi:hypothetical protein
VTVSVAGGSDAAFTSLANQTVSVTTTDNDAANSDDIVRAAFESQTHNFMVRRAELIVSHDPTFDSLAFRGTVGMSSGSNGFNVTGLDGTVQGEFALDSQSVTRVLAAASGHEGALSPAADVLNGSSPLTFWTEGRFALFRDEDVEPAQKGDFFIGYVGADWRVNQSLLLGVMAEIDWIEEGATGTSDKVSGTGWMAGPYLSAEPIDNLFLDMRAMWGQSGNSAIQDVLGSRFEGGFDTDRWLAEARLTGKYQAGELGISPDLALIYMEERQDAYSVTDGANTIAVDGQNISLGRLTSGLKISYPAQMDDVELETFVSGRVLWDFDNPGLLNLDGTTTSRDDLRAAAGAGFALRHDGSSLSATATYDGIGTEGFEAIGVKLLFSQQF